MNLLNNLSIIKGNIGNVKRLQSKESEDTGVEISVATEDSAYYKDDERISQQGWHKVVSWGPVGNAIHEHADIGDRIHIVGQLLYQEWEDEHGQSRKTAYIKPKSFDIIRKKKAAQK